jgi:hypothetical protein
VHQTKISVLQTHSATLRRRPYAQFITAPITNFQIQNAAYQFIAIVQGFPDFEDCFAHISEVLPFATVRSAMLRGESLMGFGTAAHSLLV